jgi:hypothetical protein
MGSKLGHLTKVFVVILCLIGWLEVTNHCALASLRAETAKPETCCAPQETSSVPDSRFSVCCQTLQALEQAPVQAPAFLVAALPDPLSLPQLFVRPALREAATGGIHMGDPPPRAVASCVILSRCHPAFAPPFVS